MKYVWITQEKIKNRKTRVKKEARSGNTRISRRELSLPHHRVEHSLTENKNRASFIREPVIEASLGKQCLVHLVMRPQFVQYKDGRKTHNACWPSWSDSASSFARAWLACQLTAIVFRFTGEKYCVKLGKYNFWNARLLISRNAHFLNCALHGINECHTFIDVYRTDLY